MNISEIRESIPAELKGRHFLRMEDLTVDQMRSVIGLATKLKAGRRCPVARRLLADRTLAMIFEKPSTRTRVSFEAGMVQLGGHAIFLSPAHSQLGRGEPLADTARVLSSYCDAIMARVFAQKTVDDLAAWSAVPVINGLSDHEHPCQILGDFLTIHETFKRLVDLKIAYIGDGNNVAHSLMLGAAMFGMSFVIACPEGYDPQESVVSRAREIAASTGAEISCVRDPAEAVVDANIVYTDVWASMGQEEESKKRIQDFEGFIVDESLMNRAPGAFVLHCLPAHRGEEISDATIEGPRSLVFAQAENRLHAQKALLVSLIGLDDSDGVPGEA